MRRRHRCAGWTGPHWQPASISRSFQASVGGGSTRASICSCGSSAATPSPNADACAAGPGVMWRGPGACSPARARARRRRTPLSVPRRRGGGPARLLRQRRGGVHAERGQQDGVAERGRERERHRRVQRLRAAAPLGARGQGRRARSAWAARAERVGGARAHGDGTGGRRALEARRGRGGAGGRGGTGGTRGSSGPRRAQGERGKAVAGLASTRRSTRSGRAAATASASSAPNDSPSRYTGRCGSHAPTSASMYALRAACVRAAPGAAVARAGAAAAARAGRREGQRGGVMRSACGRPDQRAGRARAPGGGAHMTRRTSSGKGVRSGPGMLSARRSNASARYGNWRLAAMAAPSMPGSSSCAAPRSARGAALGLQRAGALAAGAPSAAARRPAPAARAPARRAR